MTKKDFVEKFKVKSGMESKAAAERTINDLMACIEDVLVSGDEINFIGWGKFEVVERAAREGRNPSSGEVIQIEAKKSVKFKPGKKLNEKVS